MVSDCVLNGRRVEQEFIATAGFHGMRFVRHSTREEDIEEHWDLLMEQGHLIRVDVKDQRHKSRGGPVFERAVAVEFKNVLGGNGSLYGQADVFAYKIGDFFYLFPRAELCRLAEIMVDHSTYVNSFEKAVLKCYSRTGRDDVVSVIPLDFISFPYLRWSVVSDGGGGSG